MVAYPPYPKLGTGSDKLAYGGKVPVITRRRLERARPHFILEALAPPSLLPHQFVAEELGDIRFLMVGTFRNVGWSRPTRFGQNPLES